jgi:RNA polymerase sigma-70 factor (ECF subfamily)
MSSAASHGQITLMLREWSSGDASAAERLTPVIYSELHKLAEAYVRGERAGHTLQPTALIHEAYLRLVNQGQPDWDSRTHFFRFAAHIMRQILVDYARARNSAKRGGGCEHLTLTEVSTGNAGRSVDLLALDEALDRLTVLDERRARVLELRYFGGLTELEVAESLHLSVATVRRDVRVAEAWLCKELSGAKK